MIKLLCALLLSLLLPAAAYSLSEKEHQQLLASSLAYRQADQELGAIWKKVFRPLQGEAREKLLSLQRQWVKRGRDDMASKLMREQGLGRADAYARATLMRAWEIGKYEDASAHPAPMQATRDAPRGDYHLDDREYDILKENSEEFRAADQKLAQVWRQIYGSLQGDEKKRLLREQIAWIRQGRDQDARESLQSGDSVARAYTISTEARVRQLLAAYPLFDEMPTPPPDADDTSNSEEALRQILEAAEDARR